LVQKKDDYFFLQVHSEESQVLTTTLEDEEKSSKVDWVFKVIMPPTYSIEEAPPPEKQGKFEMRKPSLLIPKPKLRCEIFGFFLLSFPQNGRKIY
jgi:hypothetical protein